MRVTRPCRVLHVTPYFAPAFRYGGPPRSVLGLCQGLQASGAEPTVFTTSANGESELAEAERQTFDGVPVRYFARSFPRDYFAARGLRAALRETLPEIDIVHLHGLWNVPVWTAAIECHRFQVPFVLSPRGMLEGGALAYHRWRKKIWYSVWEKRYMKRAALLHATSEKEKLTLDGLAIGPEVVCVPNGLWPPERHSDVNQPGAWLDPESLVVLYLGRLHPSKRIDILVDAVEIARQANDRIQLVLAGVTDGVDVQSTLRRSQAFCRWIGELDENSKWAVLDSAHLLVMCSDSESFGMSVLEALAVGTPVVVTKTCPWKIVEDARCGRWVLQRADEIAKAILEILADPHQARAMGERGRKLVSARYSWRAIGQEMQRQYDGVLASHR